LKKTTEVFKIAPNPVMAIIPKQKRPTIFPSAAQVALFHPYMVEFVIINKIAGPGVAVAAVTSARYIIHDSIVI
jgi:hypothetical protein